MPDAWLGISMDHSWCPTENYLKVNLPQLSYGLGLNYIRLQVEYTMTRWSNDDDTVKHRSMIIAPSSSYHTTASSQ